MAAESPRQVENLQSPQNRPCLVPSPEMWNFVSTLAQESGLSPKEVIDKLFGKIMKMVKMEKEGEGRFLFEKFADHKVSEVKIYPLNGQTSGK